MALRTALFNVALGLSVAQVTSEAACATPQLCPTDAKLAKLLAGSDVVLIGRMKVPEQRLIEEARKPSPEYLTIPIQVERILKGEITEATSIRFYPKDDAYKPSSNDILGLVGEPAILFLTQVDEGPVGLYFAGYTPDALKLATALALAATRAEISRQAEIEGSWSVTTTSPHFAEAQALIARLGVVSGQDQQKVFDRLEALGEEAVPAIVALMDDRRPLRTRAISLANHSPDAFEGVRHYGPEQVVDGLDAVLNQITGESFGAIMNGGSDRERTAAVAGWRAYAADLACERGKQQ